MGGSGIFLACTYMVHKDSSALFLVVQLYIPIVDLSQFRTHFQTSVQAWEPKYNLL